MLCIQILDKVPATMEEALWISLNLEALDWSQDTEKKVLMEQMEQSRRWTAPAHSSTCSLATGTVFTDDAFHQFKDMLVQCKDQV